MTASSDRDLELLSAYLDGELSSPDRTALERRLAADPQLQKTLDELRAVKTTVRELPRLKPPRSFTLTSKMVGARSAWEWVAPATTLNWATAIAALLFAAVVTADLAGGFGIMSAQQLAAPAAPEADIVARAPVEAVATTAAESMAATPAAAAIAQATESPTQAAALMSPAMPTEKMMTEGVGGAADQLRMFAETATAAVEETQLPTATLIPSATARPTIQSPTPAPLPESALAAPPNPLRAVELALAVTLIGLIAASLVIRRR